MTRQAATSCHQASQHWMGAHQPDQRLPLAQQHQGRRGQVQAVATATTGLTCFIFRFLRRPLDAVPRRTDDTAAQRHEQEVAHLLKGQVPRPARRKHDLDVRMLGQQFGQPIRPHEERSAPGQLRAMVSHDGTRRVQYAVESRKRITKTPAMLGAFHLATTPSPPRPALHPAGARLGL